MRSLWVPAAALLLIVSAGLAHAIWFDHSARTPALLDALERLDRLPTRFGDWEGSDEELSQAMLRMAEIEGHLARRYRNGAGEEYMVLLVCGRPGPIALHTPDVCYEGAGYHAEAEPADLPVEGAEGGRGVKFKAARFVGRGALLGNVLDIGWGWYAGRGWEAPQVPRAQFGTYPYLYKLYVIRAARPTDGDQIAPGREAFLRELLAELDKTLPHEADR